MDIFLPAVKMILFVANGLLILISMANAYNYVIIELDQWPLAILWSFLLLLFAFTMFLQIKWLKKAK